jgi:arabinofuranosyltransferase
MRQGAGDASLPAMNGLRWAFATLVAIACCAMVLRVAWVSEDCFITFRYVTNLLAGHGAVFNTGEYVQGFTHPLWFLLLSLGNLFVGDLIYVAIGLGIVFTAATLLLIAHTLLRLGGASLHGGLATLLFALLCVSSAAWLSFQTSGLENPATQFLLIALVSELLLRQFERPFVVTLLGALLIVNRPDMAVFFSPIALALLLRMRDRRTIASVLLGATPLVAWCAFALFYYGDLAPNTAHAKVGTLPSWRDGVAQGVTYLNDWLRHEPFPVLVAASLLVLGSARAKTTATRVFAAGVWLQLGYVIWVGGDFMRGRFLLPIFVASLGLGLCSLVVWLREREAPAMVTAGLIAVALIALPFAPPPEKPRPFKLPASGIVDERLYYPGYHFASYRKYGRLRNPYLPLAFADELAAYVEACGPVTVHARNPGTLGYLAGPEVQVIDLLGLTDATIARLPRESLVFDKPRIGHPDKFIPVAYLARRGDISFLKGWKRAIAAKNCDFARNTEAYLESNESVHPRKLLPVLASGSP